MNLATFNCKNFKSNFHYLKELINSHDISFIIEHWLSDEEAFLFNQLSDQHSILFQSDFSVANCSGSTKRRGRPFGGKCWVVKNDVKIKSHEVINNDISIIEVAKNSSESFILVGVWLAFDDNSLERLANFQSNISLLESILKENQGKKVIILGDFNCDLKRNRDSTSL